VAHRALLVRLVSLERRDDDQTKELPDGAEFVTCDSRTGDCIRTTEYAQLKTASNLREPRDYFAPTTWRIMPSVFV